MCNKLMTFYNKTLRRQLATRVFQFATTPASHEGVWIRYDASEPRGCFNSLRRQLATRVFQFVQVDMIVVTTKLAIPLECKNFINVRIKNVK